MLRTLPALKKLKFQAAFFVSVILFAGTSSAQQNIIRRHFDVGVIHASHLEGPFDPALVRVRSKLESQFNFKSYILMQRVIQALAVNERGEIVLPNQKRLEITPTAFENGFVRMNLRIINPAIQNQIIEMSAESPEHKYIAIGGENHKGGTLIILISHQK